jgi:hypothetical protein
MKTPMRLLFLALAALLPLTILHGAPSSCGNATGGGPGDPPCECEESCPSAGPNPFHTFTGNSTRTMRDLEVWGGVGQHQLAWSRHSFSRGNSGTKRFGNAHAWRHSYQWELVSAGTGLFDVYYPAGTVSRFTEIQSGVWSGIASCPDHLTQQGSNDFFLQRGRRSFPFREVHLRAKSGRLPVHRLPGRTG